MAPFFEQPTSLLADMASLSPPRLSFYNLKIQVIDEERVIDDERPSPIRRLSEIPPLAPPPTNFFEKHHSTSRSGKRGGFDKARRLPEPSLFLEEDSSPPNYQYPHSATFTGSKGLPPRRPLIHSDPILCNKEPPARSPKRSVSMQVRATYHPVPKHQQRKGRDHHQVMLPRQAKRATSLKVAGSTEDSINPTGLKRRSASIHRPKDQSEQANCGGSGEKDKFAPRRNKSIHAGFSKTLSKRRSIVEHHANDIWIECLYLKQNGNAVTHFKSLHGQEYRKEPPTGATTIIYLEDFVEREQDSVARKASTSASNKKHTKKEKKKGALKKKFKSFVSMVKPKKEFT